ncbi:archease [Halosolutus amylolyticus]|uniref:Archease n=1 Tax=Halosolutus amylolyticus TaxID=2932267 RepID=A0ABD5PMG8_9EURY|nr:archease [Halosolutus amylolyticus]
MGFELRDHTADVGVAATGETPAAVFAAVADGLAAAMCDDVPAETGDRFTLSVSAESREALLFDYLDELVYLRDVRGELPVDNRVESIAGPADGAGSEADTRSGSAERSDASDFDAEAWSLEASARGVPLSAIDAREVKAVTYSEMCLERVDDGWEAYVVFDV